VECFTQDWDRSDIFSFGLTCKLFYQVVNVYLYRSIGISCDPEAWNKVAHLLPKHGHLTREIYLEAHQMTMNRNCFENLRAIGDFCPNLERLDLNFPLRLDLSATEADLPPMIVLQPEGLEEKAANDDVEMADVDQSDEVEGQLVVEADAPPTDIANDGQAVTQNNDGIGAAANGGGADGNAVGHGPGDGPIPADGDGDGMNDDDDESDDDDEDDDVSDDDGSNIIHDGNGADPNDAATAQAAAVFEANRQAHLAGKQAESRICAELDHILQRCARLDHFSMQWTGKAALERFYYKIPNLKALRIWDDIDEATLVNVAKHCPNLERFYLDASDSFRFTVDGMIKFLGALNSKEKSRLKRIGVYAPRFWWHRIPAHQQDDVFDEDDDNLDGDMNEMEEMDEEEDGQQLDADVNPAAAAAHVAGANAQHQAQPQPVNVHILPIGRYIETLSNKHPFLERLCLHRIPIMDEVIPLLGNFHHLIGLDLSHPPNEGLSAVGIAELVVAFRGKYLAALDLSGHNQISDDDIERLTCSEGISTLRYVKVLGCPLLAGKFLVDEWVHPDDLILEEGTWRPKDGRGRNMLLVGDGWKEQWNEM
jgi:hypothetical protein